MSVVDLNSRPSTVPVYRTYIVEVGSFFPGQVVHLQSGGPKMTVIDVCNESGEVEVAYADADGNILFEELPAQCLALAL